MKYKLSFLTVIVPYVSSCKKVLLVLSSSIYGTNSTFLPLLFFMHTIMQTIVTKNRIINIVKTKKSSQFSLVIPKVLISFFPYMTSIYSPQSRLLALYNLKFVLLRLSIASSYLAINSLFLACTLIKTTVRNLNFIY